MFVHIVNIFVAFCGLTSRADYESPELEKTTYSRYARQPDASGTKHQFESLTAVLTWNPRPYIANLNACGLNVSERRPDFCACFLNDGASVLNPFAIEHA
jgi:hypothetical protein